MSYRHVLAAAGAEALICLATLAYFCRTFGVTSWLFAVHVPLVVALLIGSVGMAAFAVTRLPVRGRLACVVVALWPAAVLTGLFTVYVLTLASNRWLNVNVTHVVVRVWLSDWLRGRNQLPISTATGVFFLGMITLVFIAHVAVWGRLFAGLATKRPTPRPRMRPAAALAAVMLVGGYGVFFYELSWRTPRSELLSADPILGFLRTSVAVEDDRQRLIADRVRQEAPQCRAAYPQNPSFDHRNVMIIMIDSLRADHMQIYGYERANTPFLAELLHSGKLKKVEFATSTCAESNCGILSTLYSKTLRHQVPEAFKIYDVLHDQGYETNLILSGDHDFLGLRKFYGTEPTRFFDGRQSRRYRTYDDRVIFEFLEQLPDSKTPAFFLFHLMSVHYLGEKFPQYSVYRPAMVEMGWDALIRGAYDRAAVTNNYDNGVLQADATLRQLFGSLDQKGYLKNSVIVILADHGEGLGDRGPSDFGHVTSLYQNRIRIPILIYDDSPAEYANLRSGTQMDVAPTLIDRLGLPMPACWEGQSLMRPPAARVSMHQTTLTTPCFAIIDQASEHTYKYMACSLGRGEELYDLSVDPAERINLIGSVPPERLDEFRARLKDWREQ